MWGALAHLCHFCAMSLGGSCEVTTLTAFSHAIRRKGGPGGDYTWEVVRLSSARSQHLTVVLRVRPCSQTTTLPRFAEGGSFFAAAATGGERSPSETMERYAFPRVRRACADDVRSRKAMIWGGFSHALVSRGENDAFWASTRWSRCAVLRFLFIFVHRPFARFVFEIVGGAMFFACWKISQADRHQVSCHHRFLRSLDFQRLLKRGRRKLPQAGEVRRPLVGARGLRLWVG